MNEIPTSTADTGGFFASYDRIRTATGARTQQQLADILDVRQSAISDAKRRTLIPDSWLNTLVLSQRLSPMWILCGTGTEIIADDMPLDTVAIANLIQDARNALTYIDIGTFL